MRSVTMFRVVLLTAFLHFAAPQVCPPGTFLYTIRHTGQHFCVECQDGTFIPNKDHHQTSCRPCEKIKDPELEILVSPCNKTHDAVIHCVDGYYRDEARNPRETGQCKKCTKCKFFIGKPCSTYRNTVCCGDENYDVVPNHYGVPVCRERPWFCRRGQYFDNKGFQCLPCPDNTFMPLDFHVQPECWKCREYDKDESYRPLHSVVISPCNSTHAPVIRCEDGFFMNPKMSYRNDALGCSPCTDCSTTDVQYEGRKCDGMEDTVCCPQPKMIVFDTPEGPVCSALLDDCDKGECPYYNVRRKSTLCAPCKSGGDTGVTDLSSRSTEHERATVKLPFISDTKNAARPVIHEESLIFGLAIGAVVTLVLLIILLIFCGIPKAGQLGDNELDDEEAEARQPLRMEQSASAENLQTLLPLSDDGEVEMAFRHDDELREKKDELDDEEAEAHQPLRMEQWASAENLQTLLPLSDDGEVEMAFRHDDELREKKDELDDEEAEARQPLRMEQSASAENLQTLLPLSDDGEVEMAFRHDDELREKKDELDDEEAEARQPLRMEQSASAENLQTLLPLSDDGEVEMAFRHDDELREKKERCKKSPAHAKFTRVKDFKIQKLPPDYRHFAESEHIKAILDLTVRIRVQHTSSDRPHNDPYYEFAGLRGAGMNRYGSGLVFQMSREFGEAENQPCPCLYCQTVPEYTRKSWAEFLVVTSAQLVFDDTECEHASCRLWFDEDNKSFRAPSLRGRKVKFVKEKDICILYCVTHDSNVSETLKDIVNRFNELRERSRLTPSTKTVDHFTKAVVIFHPHGLGKKISVGEATAKMDEQTQKWTIDAQTCPGSLGAPVCLTADDQGSETWTTIYTGENECREFRLDPPV